MTTEGVFTWQNLHRREFHTGMILYRVYIMTRSFCISLFEGTLHVDKIHVWFKITNITHVLPVPVYQQTDFPPKWVVLSRLHDTAARFRTGVKFSPRYKNQGELTPGWLATTWHFVVVSCKQIQSHERETEWTCSGTKVAPVSCKDPLSLMKTLVTNTKRWMGLIFAPNQILKTTLI